MLIEGFLKMFWWEKALWRYSVGRRFREGVLLGDGTLWRCSVDRRLSDDVLLGEGSRTMLFSPMICLPKLTEDFCCVKTPLLRRRKFVVLSYILLPLQSRSHRRQYHYYILQYCIAQVRTDRCMYVLEHSRKPFVTVYRISTNSDSHEVKKFHQRSTQLANAK